MRICWACFDGSGSGSGLCGIAVAFSKYCMCRSLSCFVAEKDDVIGLPYPCDVGTSSSISCFVVEA